MSTAARSFPLGVLLLTVALTCPVGAARAQGMPASDESTVAAMVGEAAKRFGLPERWITSVMRVESAFDPRATSHAGAMGLMQVMPQTYADLRLRYGLGANPYHPRDNILAGAAYLREMYDRYGEGGFLAAYNAGPGRYEDHLATGRPLPGETRAYVAKLAPDLSDSGPVVAPTTAPSGQRPTLFVPVGGQRIDSSVAISAPPMTRAAAALSPLFAALTAREPAQ